MASLVRKEKGTNVSELCFNEDTYVQSAYAYHNQALRAFRKELEKICDSNCHALFACSVLIFVASSPRHSTNNELLFDSRLSSPSQCPIDVGIGYEHVLEWLLLIRGTASLVIPYADTIKHGPLSSLIGPDYGCVEHEDISSSCIPPQLFNFDFFLTSPSSSSDLAVSTACSEAILLLQRLFARLDRTNDHFTGFLWPVLISEDFVGLLKLQYPEAQIVLSYFCVLLTRSNREWWVKGLPIFIMDIILYNLEVKWHNWLKWAIDYITFL